ncbi:hypothetical protein [Alcanivorax sediminis]|uniref:Uncharacterized protein n=1 Tax=Alcanivorax sediminis TaxID=2663008 RepID=A0A6N7LRI3_9GAMM|nr:hypothetical protein [Alcanivorax sediminis]MQX51856.1 hypothetical protein [Alcanivorax sediminis]
MYRFHHSPNTLKAATALGLIAAAVGIALFLSPHIQPNNAGTKTTELKSVVVEQADNTDDFRNDDLVEQQENAAQQALNEIGREEYQGELNTRPAFISPMEWQVLESIAARHDAPAQELTRLANRLRFAKLREQWDKVAAQNNPQMQKTLGNQLLNDLPHRIANQEMDKGQAQALQIQILAVIVDDSEERLQRAALEAQRIGVQFEIHSAG